MVKEITGYKFNVQAAADNAQNSLRVHYMGDRPQGNPNGDGKPYTTTQWVSVESGTYEGDSFFYIVGDFAPVLGFPQVFNVDVEDI